MTTQIGLSAEFTITIHSPGIRRRFLDWWEKQLEFDPRELVADSNARRHEIWAKDYRVSWLKPCFDGMADEAHIPPPDLIFVHIPCNVPMQDFHENFFKFLEELGIEHYELRLPWYVDLVKKGVDALIEKAEENDNV